MGRNCQIWDGVVLCFALCARGVGEEKGPAPGLPPLALAGLAPLPGAGYAVVNVLVKGLAGQCWRDSGLEFIQPDRNVAGAGVSQRSQGLRQLVGARHGFYFSRANQVLHGGGFRGWVGHITSEGLPGRASRSTRPAQAFDLRAPMGVANSTARAVAMSPSRASAGGVDGCARSVAKALSSRG